uniref:CPBP family intramembrane metalloprotease n=1 Tax=candidate division WOR-3 bacterium TaxID=2052148 RepID=A0A7V0Z7Z4_UNCW3
MKLLFLPAIVNIIIGWGIWFLLYLKSGSYEKASMDIQTYVIVYIPILLFLFLPFYKKKLNEKGFSLKSLFITEQKVKVIDFAIAFVLGCVIGLLNIGYAEVILPPNFSFTQLSLILQVINFIGAIFVAPIIEEIIFRGYGKIILEQNHGLWKTALITSIAFAIWHANWYVIPIAFLFGMVIYYAYSKRKTLFVPVIAHGLNNLIALLFTFG